MRTVITETDLRERVAALAGEIDALLPAGEAAFLIGILNGSVPFLSDLVRLLAHREVCYDVMKLSSYEDGTARGGQVRIQLEPGMDVAGRTVVLVDDICDSGLTLQKARELVAARHPARIITCTLLDKKSRRQVPISPDLAGFEVPDIFVVGYGMGAGHRFRHLPFIAEIEPGDLTGP